MFPAHKKSQLFMCILALHILAFTLFPIEASASSDPKLGVAGDFQIVSGAATTLGATLVGLDISNVTSSVPAVAALTDALGVLSASAGDPTPAALGGLTFTPGVYRSLGGAAFSMTSSITLDGNNDCNSIFIFITPAAMNTTAGISILLTNGAKAGNVYWVVGAAITIAASSQLSGNFLSAAAITVGASSSINGRFLALQAVTIAASVNLLGFPVERCAAPKGWLLISVPESVATKNLDAGETATIEMGVITVSDTRGNSPEASWQVSTVTEGVRDSSGALLGPDHFSYSVTSISHSGDLTLEAHAINSMLNSSEILFATHGSPINSASWIPVLSISVPRNQTAGIYSGSIVHSVL